MLNLKQVQLCLSQDMGIKYIDHHQKHKIQTNQRLHSYFTTHLSQGNIKQIKNKLTGRAKVCDCI